MKHLSYANSQQHMKRVNITVPVCTKSLSLKVWTNTIFDWRKHLFCWKCY